MSKNNRSGKIESAIIIYLNQKFTEMGEKQGKILFEIQELKEENKRRGEDISVLNKKINSHLEAHEKDPEFMGILPLLKKLGWKGGFRIIAGTSVFLLILAFLLMFLIEKLGLGKTLGFFK